MVAGLLTATIAITEACRLQVLRGIFAAAPIPRKVAHVMYSLQCLTLWIAQVQMA